MGIFATIFLIQHFCWHVILLFPKSYSWSSAKCRRRKTFDAWYYMVICATFQSVFHQNRQQLMCFYMQHFLERLPLMSFFGVKVVITKNKVVIMKNINYFLKVEGPVLDLSSGSGFRVAGAGTSLETESQILDFSSELLSKVPGFHVPKYPRSRIFEVRLQGPSHRFNFLFSTQHSWSWIQSRPSFENLKHIPLMSQLSFYVGYFRSF